MERVMRDRDGTIYELRLHPRPPASNDQPANKLHYDISATAEVVNDILDRVYELEERLEEQRNLTEPLRVPPASTEN